MKRAFGLAVLWVAVAARVLAQDPVAAAMERVTGPSSKMEADLRRLTDEIGGRVTGSAAYDRALQWGIAAFKAAGVDSVKLETYPAPVKWEAISASASVVAPAGFPLRVVSFGLAPSTPGPVTAPLVDAGAGTKADFERLGASAKGAIALVRSSAMKSFDDLFAEYLAGPEMMQAAVAHGSAAIMFVSTRPRDLLYRHTITWGPVAPIPMAQVAREDGLRLGAAPRGWPERESHARPAEPGRRALAGVERRRRDPGQRRSPTKSSCSEPISTRGTSARGRSTTASTACS